jgi:hypothetical protein
MSVLLSVEHIDESAYARQVAGLQGCANRSTKSIVGSVSFPLAPGRTLLAGSVPGTGARRRQDGSRQPDRDLGSLPFPALRYSPQLRPRDRPDISRTRDRKILLFLGDFRARPQD